MQSAFEPRPNSRLDLITESTVNRAGALTVAGQWRSFTAFPSILAITVVNCAAQTWAAVTPWNEFP